MFSLFKNMFSDNSSQLSEMLSQGVPVIDVRSSSEFASGHVKGSINIPLDQIPARVQELKKYDRLVVCCRSGNRSGQAKQFLEANGFKDVVNGGSWENVNNNLNK